MMWEGGGGALVFGKFKPPAQTKVQHEIGAGRGEWEKEEGRKLEICLKWGKYQVFLKDI